jgi:hypothetical protein
MSTPQVADEVSETPECGIAEDDTGGCLETEGNERRQCPILAPPRWRSGPAGNSANALTNTLAGAAHLTYSRPVSEPPVVNFVSF